MVHFHRPGKWRFSRPSVNDYSYEKASTSEDSLSGDERESFLSQESCRATSSSSSRFNIVTCVLLVFSSILNILLVGFIAYRYSQRGPANPIFPQSLYCKSLTLVLDSLLPQFLVAYDNSPSIGRWFWKSHFMGDGDTDKH